MSLWSAVRTVSLTAGAVLAILGLALTAFLSLPEPLLYNDYVSGAIFGGTILLVSGVVRVAHPDGDGGGPARSDR